MKALSLKQPWAQMVLDGMKTIETRKWNTLHRGDLLICASRSIDMQLPPSTEKILKAKGYDLPLDWHESIGVALCIVDLYYTRTMERADDKEACIAKYPRAYSFFLRNIRPVKPVPIRGTIMPPIFEITQTELSSIELL